MYRLITFFILFVYSSMAYCEYAKFHVDNKYPFFNWNIDNVKCPLEKENEKVFTINLKSINSSNRFQIQCYLQKKENKKTIFYSIHKEKSNVISELEDPDFQLTRLKFSFLDNPVSGYVMETQASKQYGVQGNKDDIFKKLLLKSEFTVIVDNKLSKTEEYFNFKVSPNSADLKDFEKFCSLDYFESSN